MPSPAPLDTATTPPRWLDWRAVDWRVVFMLFPRRRFTADELQRAAPPAPNPTLRVTVGINLLFVAAFVLWLARGPGVTWWYAPLLLGMTAALVLAGARAWNDPSSRFARTVYWAAPVSAGLLLALDRLRDIGLARAPAMALWMLMLMGTLGLWFVIVHRHQYIEMRLRELDERAKSVEMAQRLASAQLEPHFLFNTLASVQHWVQTQDPRAASLLEALTGYLRATLPMFARALHPLADELEATTRYLQVMQARLGARLAFEVDVAPALRATLLPPGLLLTLAENAVEHGVEPRLAGGQVRIAARREAAGVCIEVADDGPGPAPGSAEGVGLANARQRLALTLGGGASLRLGRGPQGGCVATLQLPEAAR
ncbi:MAG: histidine kinase [Rubrivivax sp.]|nr:histidine kinase [Rubrivivax sp.]